MTEDLHPAEEAEATPAEENESEIDLDSLFGEEEDKETAETKFLEQINKVEGRDYKSVADWSKTNTERKKIADKFYSEQGRKKETKETPPVVSGDKYAERILKIEQPNAQFVMDELKQIAKDLSIDVMAAWDKYSWLQKEAESRAKDSEEKNKNGKKVSEPSRKVAGTGGTGELSDADRALLARRPGLMEKYMKNNK